MKYPITDLYVAETIKRIAAAVPASANTVAHADAVELARFFELRHWLARLTMDDFERVAQYAKECARRSEKNILMDNGGSLQLPAFDTTLCDHEFAANPGMYDTQHRYCSKCGVAE